MRAPIERRVFGAALAAVLLITAGPPPATAATSTTATVVRVIRTSRWHRPSTDPSGLSYSGRVRRFVVCDSEVDETGHYLGANVWLLGPHGGVKRAFNTLRFSHEPTDCAFGFRGQAIFFTDDSQDKVFKLRPGRDRRWGTKDDQVTSFSTRSFGSRDPMGIAFGAGSLWVTDGNNTNNNQHAVFRINPGPNRVFDGAPPDGDDVVTRFGTLSLGLWDPEDVAVSRFGGRLFITGRKPSPVILITTLGGTLLSTVDLTGSGIRFSTGIVQAPAIDGSGTWHVYVSDAGVDNNTRPRENDGRIFELALT